MVAGPSQLQHLERIAVPTTRHKLDSCKAFFDNTCTTFRKRSCSCVRRQQAHRGPIDQYNTRDVALEAPVQQQWGYTTSSCRANLSFRLRRVRQTSTFIQTKTDYPRQAHCPSHPRRAQGLLRQRAYLPLMAQFHRYSRRSRHWSP